jgi:hypothetical protein
MKCNPSADFALKYTGTPIEEIERDVTETIDMFVWAGFDDTAQEWKTALADARESGCYDAFVRDPPEPPPPDPSRLVLCSGDDVVPLPDFSIAGFSVLLKEAKQVGKRVKRELRQRRAPRRQGEARQPRARKRRDTERRVSSPTRAGPDDDDPDPEPERVCRLAGCGASLAGRAPQAKFCSKDCSKQHERERKRAERIRVEGDPSVKMPPPYDPALDRLSLAGLHDAIEAKLGERAEGWRQWPPIPAGAPVHATSEPTGLEAELRDLWRAVRMKRAGEGGAAVPLSAELREIAPLEATSGPGEGVEDPEAVRPNERKRVEQYADEHWSLPPAERRRAQAERSLREAGWQRPVPNIAEFRPEADVRLAVAA